MSRFDASQQLLVFILSVTVLRVLGFNIDYSADDQRFLLSGELVMRCVPTSRIFCEVYYRRLFLDISHL